MRLASSLLLRRLRPPTLPLPRPPLQPPRLVALTPLPFSTRLVALSPRPFSTSAGAAAGGALAEGGASSSSPSSSDRAVGLWLLGTAGMVAVMVGLGGVTRLTRSGLSIVEWRPEGEALPRDDAAWAVEFDKYKRFPEFQRENSRMTLDEFKPIYLMEWAHRMWGRALGVGFGAPLLYFTARGLLPRGYGARLGGMLGLGALQGAVGWWMVSSGLEHDRFAGRSGDAAKRVSVSAYRLATHLGMAIGLYSLLLWNAWDLLHPRPAALTAATAAAARRVRPWALAASGTIALTVASGAFVAGNDAGHAYNDWPLYAGRAVPEQVWDPALGLRNLFENSATAQFDHRNLAYLSLASVAALHMAARRAGGLALLPPRVARGAVALGALVAGQALLGITTLMLYVPVSLGAAHQAGALALWTAALYMAHATRP